MQFTVSNRITWCSVLLLLFSTRPSQQESTEDVANAIEQLRDLIDSKFSNVESIITDINSKFSNVELELKKINSRLDYIDGHVVLIKGLVQMVEGGSTALGERSSIAQLAAESTKALLEQHYNESKTTNDNILEDLHSLKEKEISIEDKFNNMDLRFNESLETMYGKVTEIKTMSKETNSMIKIMENTTISIKASSNEIKELDNETEHLVRTLKTETKLLKYPLDEANRLGNNTIHDLQELIHSIEMWRGSLEDDIKSVKEEGCLCNSSIKSLRNETDDLFEDTPLAHEPIKLCKGTPCGVNVECQERDSKIYCSCPQGYESDPFRNCTMIGTAASPRSDLNWLTVGLDSFIRLRGNATWHDGRKLCQAKGLDLLQANNITALAKYLQDTFGDDDGYDPYWIGGRGDGSHVTWLSGPPLSRDDPWLTVAGVSDYERVANKWCLGLGTHSDYIREGALLWMDNCNGKAPAVLCG